MSELNTTDNLKKFGNEFQTKCISTLLTDKSFIEQIHDILEVDFFEGDANKWIVKNTIDYFFEYKDVPSLNVFKVKLDKVTNDLLKKSIVDSLKLVYLKTKDSDLKFVKEQFLEFCKNQKLKKAIIDSVDYLSGGDYERIKSTIDNAMKAGMERNLGHEYDIDIDTRMSQMARNTIQTGWPEIDTILDGGLGPGELGIIAAPAGIGKSWLLSRLGTNAIYRGKNVLHVTLELNENYVGLRYDSCITGINFQDVRKNVQTVKQKLKEVKGKLWIKYFPLKTISAHSIKLHAERLIMLDHKIDMIIVDYADILRPYNSNKGSNSYNTAGDIYEELRGAAGELSMPIWTASQCQRGALEHDIIEAGSISDSYKKIMTGDFVMSVSRKIHDKNNNTARFHVMKNRFGPDGLTFPAKMDTGCGEILVYSENSREGISLMNKMNNSENDMKTTLKNKWKSNMSDDDLESDDEL
jgi:hypothetical protein